VPFYRFLRDISSVTFNPLAGRYSGCIYRNFWQDFKPPVGGLDTLNSEIKGKIRLKKPNYLARNQYF
jgi:hypothetical protein